MLFVSGASAQTLNAEQQEVWRLEVQQWQMAKDKDITWIDKMVHPNLSYWDVDQPGPQTKESLLRWSRYNNSNATVLEQELFLILSPSRATPLWRNTVTQSPGKTTRRSAKP
jgi:hypothetical protein